MDRQKGVEQQARKRAGASRKCAAKLMQFPSSPEKHPMYLLLKVSKKSYKGGIQVCLLKTSFMGFLRVLLKVINKCLP